MKNKNFRKLKYVSGNPQNAGFCTIYSTASQGLGGPQTPGLHFFSLASLAVLHLLLQNSLLLLKVLKALCNCNQFYAKRKSFLFGEYRLFVSIKHTGA